MPRIHFPIPRDVGQRYLSLMTLCNLHMAKHLFIFTKMKLKWKISEKVCGRGNNIVILQNKMLENKGKCPKCANGAKIKSMRRMCVDLLTIEAQ